MIVASAVLRDLIAVELLMNRYRFLTWPAYLIASILIVIPMTDTALSVWPPRLGDVGWRFGMAGVYSRTLMTSLLGLLVFLAFAAAFEHRRLIRVLSVLSGIAAATILATMVFFALDAVQMRARVPPEAKTAFDLASVAAFAKYAIATLILSVTSVASWRVSRAQLPVLSPPPLVVSPKS